MISSVIIAGILQEKTEGKYRLIKSYSQDAFHPEQGKIVSHVPLLYWTRDEYNLLTEMETGKKVLIRGHVESNKEIGLYVLVEYLTFL